MTSKQEKIAERILKELQEQENGLISFKRIQEIMNPFYSDEKSEKAVESHIILSSLKNEYEFIRIEGNICILTAKGKQFKSFKKERRSINGETARRKVSFWISIIAIIIALATFSINTWFRFNSNNQLEDLKERIEKLENSSKSSDTEHAPMRQETDSISKPLKTQQNQGIQEK